VIYHHQPSEEQTLEGEGRLLLAVAEGADNPPYSLVVDSANRIEVADERC